MAKGKEWLSPEERNERRLQLWNGAVHIVKTMADVHTGHGFEDCGWRGDHRDVAAVAEYLGTMDPETLSDQVTEAATWINADRRDHNGLVVQGRPIVHDLLNHLRRKFPHG